MGDIYFSRAIEPDPQAVIAGTLCLMSCTMQSGGALYLPKIIDNLNFLADSEDVDFRLRILCRRMACHWEAAQIEKLEGLVAAPHQDESQPFVVCADCHAAAQDAAAAEKREQLNGNQSALLTPAAALVYTKQYLASLGAS